MQIPAGPNQYASAYLGNPGALQANIQKDQQQKPSVMPDFAKLIALGTVTSNRDAASKAQALQQLQQLQAQSPMGKPPTVFEQVQRKAAQMTMGQNQPAQPQGLPGLQGEAQGSQGIDQLASDFEFAGGGIVAFNEGEEVESSARRLPSESEEEYLFRLQNTPPTQSDAETERLLATRPPAKQKTVAPKVAPSSAPATPANPMRAAIEAEVLRTLGKDEDAEFQKGVLRNRQLVGIDELLKGKEADIAEMKALQAKQQADRMPLWVTQLQEFSRANPRIGLGAAIGASGAGAEKVREKYQDQDREFQAQVMKLKDAVLQARIEGRYKDAAAGEAALRDLTANKRQAEVSGTSLLNNAEQIAQRREQARQHLASIAANKSEGKLNRNSQLLADVINKASDDVDRRISDAVKNGAPEVAPEQRLQMVKAEAAMRLRVAGLPVPAEFTSTNPTRTMSMADVQATAAANKKSVEEVMAAAKAKGFLIK